MHKTHIHRIFKLLILILLLFPDQAIPGGFQNNALSMKAVSMGGTFTGVASDASAAFFNPGAMTFLEYSQLAVGASFRLPSTSYLSPYTGNFDMENKLVAAAHLYGVGKLNDNMAVGISVNTPYNLHSKWDDNWPGRYVSREAIIRAVYVQPSFSYMLNESFSVGGGPVIGLGKTLISKAVPYSSNTGDINMELEGHSVGIGFNLGLFYKLNENFNIGVSYRSAVKMNIKKGDATFSHVPTSLAESYPSSTGFKTEYKLPSVITAGVSYNLTRDLMLCADLNYTTWKAFDSLRFSFNDRSSLDFGSGKFYHNTLTFRIGAQYELSEKVAVRAGAAIDQSPVDDEYLSPEEPDADRIILSLGGSVKFGSRVTVDAAYMLQNIKEREAVNGELSFGGVYKNLINIFGFTVNYQF
jgi:long-chain fatty acid transport protein